MTRPATVTEWDRAVAQVRRHAEDHDRAAVLDRVRPALTEARAAITAARARTTTTTDEETSTR